jgi:hypothetical protein
MGYKEARMGTAFEKFVESKWRDALNVAAAEPSGWEASGSGPARTKQRKRTQKKTHAEKAAGSGKKTMKITEAENFMASSPG